MTLAAPTFPLTQETALQTLQDALGDNYGAATDPATLTRALGADTVSAPDAQGVLAAHPRPWATAARLIRWNTEYEVSKGLNARVDRKLQQLDRHQEQMDDLAGITAYVPSDTEGQAAQARSGSVPTKGVW